jgi:hypothetical protein
VTSFLVSSRRYVRASLAPRLAVAVFVALATFASRAFAADDATTQARSHYEMGLKLFDARENEQALIEFHAADDLKPRPAALFMMAQCEYLLGRLKDARAHYARYSNENPDGEFVELAKDRIQSIDKRPSTFVINTVPDDVTVHIRADGTPSVATDVTGQAPNNFQVPRGRYRIDVTRANYQGQTRVVDIDIAETKPLFFKLDPIPARLEIETVPPLATLYVNGNRARNPYRQDLSPGPVEVFAEAPDHDDKTIDFTLSPGEQKHLLGPDSLRLNYAQRSGRPELIVASSLIGAFVGVGAVAAAIGPHLEDANVASVLLVSGGGIVGIIGGALAATPLVPRYIPDNHALFILGDMWIGGTEGALIGILAQRIISQSQATSTSCLGLSPCRPPLGVQLRAGFLGSIPGLALGLATGALTADHAPTYGRAALIQSSALVGTIAGGLMQMTARLGGGSEWTVHDRAVGTMDGGTHCVSDGTSGNQDLQLCAYSTTSVLNLVPGALIGLNVGLAAGLAAAYLPDQSKYGPTWKRVLVVDLAVGAGMVAGATIGCVANQGCLDQDPNSTARAISAGSALVGGAVGLIGGILLTRHFDDDGQPPSTIASSLTFTPTPALPGGTLPGLSAMGAF